MYIHMIYSNQKEGKQRRTSKMTKEVYEELTKLVTDKKKQNPNYFKIFRIGGQGNYKEMSDRMCKGRINHKIQR